MQLFLKCVKRNRSVKHLLPRLLMPFLFVVTEAPLLLLQLCHNRITLVFQLDLGCAVIYRFIFTQVSVDFMRL